MITKQWSMTDTIETKYIEDAAHLLRAGEVIAFPTETVYGLGADATNEKAVMKIFQAKGRPADNPLIVHVANKEQAINLIKHLPPHAEKLMDHFSPGPITFVLKSNGKVVSSVTGGLDTVGIRIPDHPVALQLLEKSNVPLAAPSANISGKPSPTTAQHVLDDMEGKIAGVIDGGPAKGGIESTVIDCTKEKPVILRVGSIAASQMEKIVGAVEEYKQATKQDSPMSPGLKYKHYAPEVPLILLIKQSDNVQYFINKEKEQGNRVGMLLCGKEKTNFHNVQKFIHLGESEKEVAANLYASLRSFTKVEVDSIICVIESTNNIGQAVMDRLQRAATEIY